MRTARSATRRRTSCSRRRTSTRSPCCGRRGGCGSAPTPRRAGRRASTHTWPSRRRSTRPSSSSPSPARAGPGIRDVHGELPRPAVVRHRPELVERLSGLEIPVEEQVDRLQRLGFEVAGDQVTVPTWRMNDVTRPVDLVEEVVRFRIEEVPSTLPERAAPSVQLTKEQRLRRRVEDVLVGAGYAEAYTWTLVPAEDGRLALRGAVHDRDGSAADRPPARPARVRRAEPERRRSSGSLCSRSRASSGRRGRSCRRSTGTSPGSPREASSARRERSRRSTRRSASRSGRSSREAGRAARTPYGRIAELPGDWGYFELDLETLLAAGAGRDRLRGRDHVPAAQAGLGLRRRRGRRLPASWSQRHTRPPDRSSASCGSSTSTAASRSARGRSRSHWRRRSSRRSAPSPTRTRRSCASGSSPRSPSGSAPSCAPSANPFRSRTRRQ